MLALDVADYDILILIKSFKVSVASLHVQSVFIFFIQTSS